MDETDAGKRDRSGDWPRGRSRGRQFRGRRMLTCGLEVKEMRGKLSLGANVGTEVGEGKIEDREQLTGVPAGVQGLIDLCEELVEVEPAARRVLGYDGVDRRVVLPDGLNFLADRLVPNSSEGVIERVCACGAVVWGSGCGLFEAP